MEVGHAAEATAGEVEHELEVHEEKQKTHEKHLHATLDEMKENQRTMLGTLQDILRGK